MVLQTFKKARNFLCYFLMLNESADFSNMSQLLVFIRGFGLPSHTRIGIRLQHARNNNWRRHFYGSAENFARLRPSVESASTVDGGKKHSWSEKGSGGANQD